MKRLLKTSFSSIALLLLIVQLNMLTSCSDDMSAENYYTFTGEMISDFLENREEFSMFTEIVNKAGQMDFLSSRGRRTFFPPINSGVEDFLEEYGYSSVDEIPEDYCDTLVKACLVDNSMTYTYNLTETYQMYNELDLPLVIITDGDSVDDDGEVLSIINRRAAIINDLKNDTVENGVIHPVDRVLVPNTSMGSQLLDENHDEFEIYYAALSACGLLDSLARYRDEDYEEWKEDYDEFLTDIRSGGIFSSSDEGYLYYAKRPDHRYSGFTVLIVPDDVLIEKYGDTYGFYDGMPEDEALQALLNLAVDQYSGSAAEEIFGLDETDPTTGETYLDAYFSDINSLTNRHNALNMFLSYQIIDRQFESTAKLINCWGVYTTYADPAEWISTLLEFSTIKLEKVYSTVDSEVESAGGFYVNHCAATDYQERVRGAILTTPDADNFSLNVAFYYLDDIVAYNSEMRNTVMNTRIRMDFVTLWPELTNNAIRLCGNIMQAYSESVDASEDGGDSDGYNYYIPSGYLDDTTISENSVFFVQRPKIAWWNWGGDEINILGSAYDVEFPLPDVPPGTYELRIGYPGMLDRGIAQIYVDDVAQGIPIDMRYRADDSRVGGLYNDVTGFRCVDDNSNGIYTAEELEDNARVMKNNGYYSGPKSIFTDNDGTDEPRYSPSSCTLMYNNAYTFRRKICNVTVKAHTVHTIRVRCVWSLGNKGCFVLDYMELVPISICGAGGIGEDIY